MMRRIAVAVAVVSLSAATAGAQSRADLLKSATTNYDDFKADVALEFARAAVNPALGPTDTAWVRGVHLLTQILVEGGKQDLAKTWARWAARIAPDMKIDTVNFIAGVVATLREARVATSSRTGGDAVTKTTWRWPARTSAEANGRVVAEASMGVPVNVRVVGGGLIPAGTGLSLLPGTYEFEAGAPGFLPARLSREVLPGVTTVLNFSLASAAVASDIIAENVRQRFFRNLAPLTVRRFGSPAACAAAGFVSKDGLMVTSYHAVRGADSLSSDPGAPGSKPQPVRVAAYDVTADVAILQVPGARTDSLAIATSIVDGESVWAAKLTDCKTPTDARVRVTEWNDRPRGNLLLSDAPLGATNGSPLIDVSGSIAGLWITGTGAVAAPKAAAVLDQARRNVAANQLLAMSDVSRKENHTYGSVVIASDVTMATIRVTPLEDWQWSTLATSGPTPLSFTGPMGRYKVEVTAPGDLRREQEITVRPDAEQRVFVALQAVAAANQSTTQPIAVKKGGSKLPWILGGVALAGVGGALALGGGGGGGNNGCTGSSCGGTTKGSVTFHIPVVQP